jgi:hypothetical protein
VVFTALQGDASRVLQRHPPSLFKARRACSSGLCKLSLLRTNPLVAQLAREMSLSSCRVHAGFAVFSWGVAE